MPQFQGKDVMGSQLQLSGGAKDLVHANPPQIDQIVRVTVEGRVTGVSHTVDEKSGDLIEVVRVKVIEVDSVDELTTPGGVVTPMSAAGGSP